MIHLGEMNCGNGTRPTRCLINHNGYYMSRFFYGLYILLYFSAVKTCWYDR